MRSTETLQNLTPRKTLCILLEGNRRFTSNRRRDRDLLQQVKQTSEGQTPFATILSCMDSRTSPELVFDQGLGDIFSLRVAGNIINEDILGSMEFACKVIGSRLIIVLGHTKCGAVIGACDSVDMGNLSGLLKKLQPPIEKVQSTYGSRLAKADLVEKVVCENVLHSMNAIVQHSSILCDLYEQGSIGLAGGIYSVDTGTVEIVQEMFADD